MFSNFKIIYDCVLAHSGVKIVMVEKNNNVIH